MNLVRRGEGKGWKSRAGTRSRRSVEIAEFCLFRIWYLGRKSIVADFVVSESPRRTNSNKGTLVGATASFNGSTIVRNVLFLGLIYFSPGLP
jgi:hypothetical protein